MLSVPFQISEVHGGLTEGHGVAYVEDDYLVLEVQTASSASSSATRRRSGSS
jgi:hypothetical protein